jgi:hypothetical protein
LPIFSQVNIPAKNVTWKQFIFADNVDVSTTGEKASFTIPTGKIGQVLEIIMLNQNANIITAVRIRPNGAATQARYDIGVFNTGVLQLLTRSTVCNAGDIITFHCETAAAASNSTCLVSGQFADA